MAKKAGRPPAGGGAKSSLSASPRTKNTRETSVSGPLLDPAVFQFLDESGLSTEGDPNVVILPPRCPASASPASPHEEPEEGQKKMSKRKRRKLEQLQRKHDTNARREEILKELELYRLDRNVAVAEATEKTEKRENQTSGQGPSARSGEKRSGASLQTPLEAFCASYERQGGGDCARETKNPAAFAALEPLRKGKRRRREFRQEKKDEREQQIRLAQEQQMQQMRQEATTARQEGVGGNATMMKTLKPHQERGVESKSVKRKLAEENSTASPEASVQLRKFGDHG
ncbi:helicase associated domain (ha2) protein, partial [Toxoplasma gondii CAST]